MLTLVIRVREKINLGIGPRQTLKESVKRCLELFVQIRTLLLQLDLVALRLSAAHRRSSSELLRLAEPSRSAQIEAVH